MADTLTSPRGSVLLLEPNMITRKLIAGILAKNNFQTFEAETGDQAVEALARAPDLVILDVKVNSEDHLGFVRKMQKDYATLPLIALLEADNHAEVEGWLGMARLSFIEKPVKPDALIASIEAHLAEEAQHRAEDAANMTETQVEIDARRKEFMRRAIDLSQVKMDENAGGPFGAVIVKGGKIIGEGWNCVTSAQTAEAYNFGRPGVDNHQVRYGRAAEFIEVCKGLWDSWDDDAVVAHASTGQFVRPGSVREVRHAGRHFQVRNAQLSPKPAQPRLPIMIGGGGEKVMLRLVAEHADIWNNLGAYHGDAAHKREVLREHCRAIGRDPAEILVTQQTLAAIAMDRTDAARRTEKVVAELGFLDATPELALTGTPDEIRARVEKNRALGINGFMMSFGRRTDPEHVRLFAREVVGSYR